MNFVGTTVETKNYGPAFVLSEEGKYVEVVFLNTGNTSLVIKTALYSGDFADQEEKARIKREKEGDKEAKKLEKLMTPSVQGVGYHGIGPHKHNKGEIQTWSGMLRRAYSKEWHDRHPQYADCVVCERWLCLQNFIEDFRQMEGYDRWFLEGGYQLDKDLKIEGNKIYGPDTCVLVSKSENVSDAYKKLSKSGTRKPRESHTWMVRTPEGEVIEVKNLSKFCREHELIYSSMTNVLNRRYGATHHRGYTAP